MAKAQNQAKAAAEVPQDVTETLPEEVEEQISLLPEEAAAVTPAPDEQEEVRQLLPEEAAAVTPAPDEQEEVRQLVPEKTAAVCTLDRSQPYGEVYGAGGIAFEQDGKYFDRSGNQIPEAEA